jgi:hypothetical protein
MTLGSNRGHAEKLEYSRFCVRRLESQGKKYAFLASRHTPCPGLEYIILINDLVSLICP